MKIKTISSIFTVILVLFNVIDISFAQSNEVKLDKDYLKGYINDTRILITSPARWDSTGWIKAGLFVGMTAGLYAFDEDIQDWAQKNRNSITDRISNFARPFGDWRYTLPSLGLFYFYGHLSNDDRAKKGALLSIESLIQTGIFTQIIKFAGHRHRPNSNDSSSEWDGPGLSRTNLSFPSGHASSAFAVATVIASEYKDNFLIPPLSYSIATLTALSRVNDNKHWASDVFFGSGIGYFIGKTIFKLHNGEKDQKFAILPVINDRYSGIMAKYKF